MNRVLRHLLLVAAAALALGPQVAAQTPAPARPNFSGTWTPVDPAKSAKLFDVGLSVIPDGGRLIIEHAERRLTVTITMPDGKLDPLLTISGRFYPSVIYRIYESGRTGGAGAQGPVAPTQTSWTGDRLVIPNPRPSTRPMTMTLSMEGERLKMETRIEVDAVRANNVTELFAKVK